VIAYLPHFDCGVLGAGGYFVVIEGIPFEIEDGTSVTRYFGRVYVNATNVFDGYDDESSAPAFLRHYGHKFGIDSAKGRVVRCIFGYLYVFVADVFFVRIAVYVSVF
jgi:hypothetical protein